MAEPPPETRSLHSALDPSSTPMRAPSPRPSSSSPSSPSTSTSTPASSSPSLVPRECRFLGSVFIGSGAEIHGEVVGPVRGAGRLVVGPDAKIRGAVEVGILELAGQVEGEITALERASLAEGATLRGTLSSPSVRVAEGAHIQGPCRIGPLSGVAKSRF
ncbi:MAG TPA: polymer-forming cytoskeletal protein [Myxococcales bacterium]|nr:polymer-forming cytoskeletal protein [Myxococcales bacterium]